MKKIKKTSIKKSSKIKKLTQQKPWKRREGRPTQIIK